MNIVCSPTGSIMGLYLIWLHTTKCHHIQTSTPNSFAGVVCKCKPSSDSLWNLGKSNFGIPLHFQFSYKDWESWIEKSNHPTHITCHLRLKSLREKKNKVFQCQALYLQCLAMCMTVTSQNTGIQFIQLIE